MDQVLEQGQSPLDDLQSARLELAAADLADLNSERLEGAANLVLDIDELALEQPSRTWWTFRSYQPICTRPQHPHVAFLSTVSA